MSHPVKSSVPANSSDPVDNAYQQYLKDLAQWEKDCQAEQAAAAEWKTLIGELGPNSKLTTQEKFNLVLYQLLGPTMVDKYYGSEQNIQGDIMNMTSDIRTMTNISQGIFNDTKNGPLTAGQAAQFNEALKDLYKIFQSQKTATKNSQWLDPNDDQNAITNLNGLYKALGTVPPGGNIIKELTKMSKWWQPTANGNPNPNLAIFQNNYGSLLSTISSPSQAAQATATYMVNSQNTIEGAIKAMETSIITLENQENQAFSKANS